MDYVNLIKDKRKLKRLVDIRLERVGHMLEDDFSLFI
jgi:hypothetical protein